MDAIITKNGQVLILKVDKCYYDANNNVCELETCGAQIKTSLENTLVLNQNHMDENSYKDLVNNIAQSLISEEGTITKYDPSAKKVSKIKKLK